MFLFKKQCTDKEQYNQSLYKNAKNMVIHIIHMKIDQKKKKKGKKWRDKQEIIYFRLTPLYKIPSQCIWNAWSPIQNHEQKMNHSVKLGKEITVR